MCQEKLPMKDVLDLFRQKFELKCSERRIARSLDVSRATVANYLRRFTAARLTWPLPQDMDHDALEKRLFPAGPVADTPAIRAVPDFPYLHGELKRKGVTLMTLWEEYWQALAGGEEGYSYSRFCELYGDFAKTLAISMRQHHVAGDKMFVDYSGDKIDIMISTVTGEMKSAEIFIAVLGASNYTYAEATWTQTSCDWIHSHIRALKFFGGVTAAIVPDNLAAGVTKPNFYEPTINRAYQDFASYYDTVILPARVRRAKDKAKAEIGVRLAQIWILAKLRNRVFTSLAETNSAIRELLEKLNDKPMQKIKKSRRELYEAYDLPALKTIPAKDYVHVEFKTCRANIDYHVEIDGHYYSVSHELRGQVLEARFNDKIVEIYHHGKRIASHRRNFAENKRYETLPEHMPSSHRRYAEWSPSRIIGWGQDIATEVGEVCRGILESKKHPEHGFRSCIGIIRMEKKFGRERLINACKRALALRHPAYGTILNILNSGTDKLPLPGTQPRLPIVTVASHHDNIRGCHYYDQENDHDHRGNTHQTDTNENACHGEISARSPEPAGPSGFESSGNAGVDRGRRMAGAREPQDEREVADSEVQDIGHDGGHRLPDQARAGEGQDSRTGQSRVDFAQA